jgi:hypothetical protein
MAAMLMVLMLGGNYAHYEIDDTVHMYSIVNFSGFCPVWCASPKALFWRQFVTWCYKKVRADQGAFLSK